LLLLLLSPFVLALYESQILDTVGRSDRRIRVTNTGTLTARRRQNTGGSDGRSARRPWLALVVAVEDTGGVGTRERTTHCAAAAADSVDTRCGMQLL